MKRKRLHADVKRGSESSSLTWHGEEAQLRVRVCASIRLQGYSAGDLPPTGGHKLIGLSSWPHFHGVCGKEKDGGYFDLLLENLSGWLVWCGMPSLGLDDDWF